jgi:hypothetical protein
MKQHLNCDSYKIKNFERTPEGYLKTWIVAGIPDKILEYDGGKKEKINSDALFDEKSVASAIGKPICMNHPPVPIDSRNFTKYAKGSILQQFDEDDAGGLVLSAIIHDADMADQIESGKIKYFSSGYGATKQLNSDGILDQTSRHYNHFAGLTPEYSPRAGESSIVLIFNNDSTDSVGTEVDSTTETKTEVDSTDSVGTEVDSTTETKTEVEVDSTTVTPASSEKPRSEDKTMKDEIKTQLDAIKKESNIKARLAADWTDIMAENGLYFNFDADVSEIKKTILSCFYDDKIIRQLNENNMDGFWLNFQVQHDSNQIKPKSVIQKDSNEQMNYDSVLDEAMKQYESVVCGK